MRRVAALAVACAVVAGACGSSDTGDARTAATLPPPSPAHPVTVRMLTHDSFAVSPAVLDRFSARTGIRVKVVKSGDAGAALNQAILTKGKPLADVFFGVDNTFLSRALDAGIFEPYASPALADVASTWRLDPANRVSPVDHGDVCVNADKERFGPENPLPRTLDDLADPRFKGQLVVENPATSSPGLAFVLATIARYGDGWESYWKKLRANDVKVTAGWEEAYNGAFSGGSGEGDRPLVVSYASSPPAEVYYADPQPADAPTAVIDDTCFRQVEFVGVLRGTRRRAAARRVVDLLLSREFQADMPLQMFVFPVLDGVALPEVFTRYAARPAAPLTLPPSRIGENRERWIRRWTQLVLG